MLFFYLFVSLNLGRHNIKRACWYFKLDTTLTRTLETDHSCRNLINAIVATAKQNGNIVVACNIETALALDLVQARGVESVQGFYLD